MADSKVEIQVTANTDEAKRSLADLESAADRAMDAGANSAKKFAKGLDEVGESAKLSAREIKGVVAGMASMAAGVASAALKDAVAAQVRVLLDVTPESKKKDGTEQTAGS